MGRWRVVGHAGVVSALDRAVREGRTGHAYLLTGPPQVGKRTLALELAKALNCTGDDPPCGACRPCRRIQDGAQPDGSYQAKFPDVELVGVGGLCNESEHDHTRDGSKDIRICQVRRLEALLSLRPFEGRRRVVIIDPADALNATAADAFLKTLEEPPPSVVILLVTAREGRLPETIVSRCQRLVLAPLPRREVEAALTAVWGADPGEAKALARLAAGRLGWAVAALGNPAAVEERRAALARLAALPDAPLQERFAFAEELAARFPQDRVAVLGMLELWEAWWRDVLLAAAGCPEQAVHEEQAALLREAAARHRPEEVVAFLRSLAAARRHLEENVNARLALEVLMLDLPAAGRKEEGAARPR
ncbi:MAG TPA: DNA polymerase III subunit [Dehalococcoidia bacterium]